MTQGVTSIDTINSISDDEEKQDTSSNTSETDSEFSEVLNEVVPSFGNIAVKNSSDVHFGNKTYYQGPVTIKQILYANSQNSECDSEIPVSTVCTIASDNPCFVPDNLGINIKTDIQHQSNEAEDRKKQTKGRRWLQKFSRQHLFLIVSLVTVLLLSLVTLLAVLLTRHHQPYLPQYPDDSDEQDFGIPPKYPVDPFVNVTLPGKLKIISRIEWLAEPPVEEINKLVLPIPYVIISHTATESCSEQAVCKSLTRDLQTHHIEGKGLRDIAYNFLVGGDGYAYYGRGWNVEGAHTFGYNSKSIGIAFLGTFHKIKPPHYQILAAKQLIQKGIESGVIKPNYQLFGEKQLQDTSSPGAMLYEEIQTWTGWVNKTFKT